ncbi:radical SAM protein, partial [Patescibacteria group bacterium]|nr:radical SAM protein [Patescibacteria group bacterium]
PAGIENVEGLAFRKDGKIIRNERKTSWLGFKDSKRLPWEDVHMEYYFKEGRIAFFRVYKSDEIKLGAMTATRGCPNQCTFCSSARFFKGRWRYREVDLVIEEAKFLIDNYGVNLVIFNDVNISLHRKWFLKLLGELKKLNIKWLASGGLSIRTINDEEIIKKMYESGVAMFNVAIESGNDEILKKMKKPLTISEVENVVRLIRKHGNGYIIGSFIVGFPFETKKQVMETFDFVGKLKLDWSALYCLHPLPGTEVYDYCIDNKLMVEYNVRDCRNLEFHSAVEIKYPDYTKEELNKLNYLYNIKYNFLKNRNLMIGTKDRLAQAERDFNYVLGLAPDHFFAYFCLAEIAGKRGDADKRSEYLKKAKEILETDKSFDWSYYISGLGVDVNKAFLDIKE